VEEVAEAKPKVKTKVKTESKTTASPKQKLATKSAESGPVLEKVRHWSDPVSTRVVLYTRSLAEYRVGELPADKARKTPPRLYVDLLGTDLGDEVDGSMEVTGGAVLKIRTAERDEGFLRVVLDLDAPHSHRVFPMTNPNRVVVDISIEDDQLAQVIGQKLTAKAAKGQPRKEAKRLKKKSKPGVSLSMMAGLGVKRIVVDAGHGGKDPGAIGPSGTLEKDIALDVAKRLGKMLSKELKLEVLYTRKDDRFVPLEGRTAFANKNRADLFISIHFNAHRNRKFRGVEVFYLDLTDDRYSIKLAARENATSEKSISDLRYILADLTLKSHVDDSINLSKYVQKGMVGSLRRKYKKVRDMGIKSALFYVLIGARMPSILVEGSFITNPMEEKRLRTKAYRQKVAAGIFTGVKNFIHARSRLLDPN